MYKEQRKFILFSHLLVLLLLFCEIHPSFSIVIEDIVNINEKEGETELSPDDFANVPIKEIDLSKLGIKVKTDPTLGNKVEGDMILPESKNSSKRGLRFERSAVRFRNRKNYRRWPNGEIPYTISTRYGPYSRSIIAKAMDQYHQRTCIKFVPRDASIHRDYLFILADDGCYSLVGRAGGRQPLSLDSGCIQTGTIIHELMHAAGFYHEQSRSDRDDYIQIVWQNVMRGAEDQFEKYGPNIADNLGEDYDYSSIMHYGPYAFSDNGRRTIIALKSGSAKMGQREDFSDQDITKLNKLYTCSNNFQPDRSNSRTTQAATTPEVPEVCEDTNWRCAILSLPVFNQCENKEIAEVKCRKSCGTCKPTNAVERPKISITKQDCRDLNPSCPTWSRRGFCNSFNQLKFMQRFCAESCGFCDINRTTNEKCEDKASYLTCNLALLIGGCDSRDTLCRKTCDLC